MGAADGEKGLQEQTKRIDDSQGMCGSEAEYDTCWSRVCSPDRSSVLKDVLKGLLVLLALAIVITVIFLLCYFLLNDIEKKEEEVVDSLIKDFATGNRNHIEVPPEFSTHDGRRTSPNDGNVYDTAGATRSDLTLQGIVVYPSQNQGESKLTSRLDNLSVTSNSVSEPSTPTIENADDRVFKVEGAHPTLSMKGSIPFRTTIDSEISSPDGARVDAFLHDTDIGEPTLDVFTELAEAEPTAVCVSLRLPLCSGTMPWTLTAFPNFVNNNNLSQLRESLKYFQSTVVGSRCSTRAAEYSCAILEPSCGPDSVPLPPCRAFCQDIVSTCSEFLVTGNEHNSAFICSRFPDSRNPNVCVDINRASLNVTNHQPTDFDDGSSQDVPDLPDSPDLNSIITTDVPEIATVSDILKIGQTYPDGSSLPESVTEPTENSEDPQVIMEKSNLDRNSNPELPGGNQALPSEKGEEPGLDKETIRINFAKSKNATNSPEFFICDNSKFICEDGSDCLDYESVCDGIQHCLDNTDERNCTKQETLTTPSDFSPDNEDAQGESTTELVTISEDNAIQGTENSENFETPKRFSLSDMLSSSALVANTKVPTLSPSPKPPKKKLRFGNRGSDIDSKTSKGKAFDSSQNLDRNTFSSFGPFPFTAKPTRPKEKKEEDETTSTKLSLAALLSSSSLAKVSLRTPSAKVSPRTPSAKVSPRTPSAKDSLLPTSEKVSSRPRLLKGSLRPLSKVSRRPPPTKPSPRLITKVSPRPLLRKVGPRPLLRKVGPRPVLTKSIPRPTLNVRTSTTTDSTTVDTPLASPADAPILIPSGRSLSALLSSALPSFSSPPSRQSSSKCKELKCLDGSCISMKQLRDGIVDCPDGSDEKQRNHISLK